MGHVVPPWWADLCSDYFRWLARKGRRRNTVVTYRSELYDFGSWLLEHRVGCLREVSRGHIEAWQDDLLLRKAPSTQRVAASALRGLLKFAAAEELDLAHPTLYLRVTMPRVPENQPRPVPLSDLLLIQRFLSDATPMQAWRLRTRALFWLLYSSGCRIAEALSLMRGSFEADRAVVIQKGGRQHTLVVSAKALAAIDDYLAVRVDRLPNLFASLDTDGPLRKKEVQESWDLLAISLGITRFKSHQLRHACVTAILRETGDIMLAAKHVGHRGLQTIQGYAEVAMDKRRAAVAMLDGALAG